MFYVFRTLGMVVILLVSASIGFSQTAYQQQFAPQFDNVWTVRTEEQVRIELEKTLTELNGKWYAKFSVRPAVAPQPEPAFFAAPVPLNSSPIVQEGMIEFGQLSLPAKASSLRKVGTEDWWVFATLKLRSYRMLDYRKGWSDSRLTLAFLEWKGDVISNRLDLRSENDVRSGTNDNGITAFVASVFNIQADQVKCTKPTVGEIQQWLDTPRNQERAAEPIQRRTTRDPYYRGPDPSQRPTRARYN